ncbi:MAG: DNA-methyltransferase [Candidatus Heimdallarchaeaceae archaeon]
MNVRKKNSMIKDRKTTTMYQIDEIMNKIIQGDAIEVLRKLPESSIDLVFMDPPYFLQLPKKQLKRWKVKTEVDAVKDKWDQFTSFQEYDAFIHSILTELQRVMKENSTIWIISTYHSIHRIGKIMQDLGFWILSHVIWVKTNPMPNWLGVRFTNATETLIWAVKNKKEKKYFFDKEMAKKFGVGKIGSNVWVLPICTGKERLKDEEGKKLHSTQKPIELLKRVILCSTQKGGLVLDPLAGTGTTGVVAKALKRNFIMIEKNEKYIQGIISRFNRSVDFEIVNKKIEKRELC